jgi:D-alanine-D-alanine ligase
MQNNKKKIAVFFGGKSFEHDISILTGLQVSEAIDKTKYEVIPVYVDLEGNWWTGEALLNKAFYPLTAKNKERVSAASFVMGKGKPYLLPEKKGIFAAKPVYFDFALPAFHGDYGENGCFQGLMEMAGIPYSSCRVLASSVFMDKVATKRICRSLDIPVLPEVVIQRPDSDEFLDVEKLTADVSFDFPVMVKPMTLGSSIGVSKANNKEELYAAVLKVFALDSCALIEPFVNNLEEYNVSVSAAFNGEVRLSAIEQPVRQKDILSFNDKYKAGAKSAKTGGQKFGASSMVSEGMLSMTRSFNPDSLSEQQTENIKTWAKKIFTAVGGLGNPRIDFMCDSATGEMWLGEVNPIPGSFSYFLWERAEPKVNFVKLVNALIDEGFKESAKDLDFYKKLTDNKIFK